MRVGVIRADLPGPLHLADLESTSQTNFPTEPAGQTRVVSRPTIAALTSSLAGLPAALGSTAPITFPLTLTGANNTLRIKTSSAASFTVVTVATAVYASLTALLLAVNAGLTAGSVAAKAVASSVANELYLESNTTGPGAYIAYDSTGGGSTFNTPAQLVAGGASFTFPSAAALIAGTLPVGGPLDVRTATIETLLGGIASAATVLAIQNAIAPRIIETDVAIKSFEVGNLAAYLKSTFTPDPHRLPALALGAAVTVTQDDGNTIFTSALPNITGVAHNVPNAGDLTITGVGLGNVEFYNDTIVHVTSGVASTNGTQPKFVRLHQVQIAKTLTGGTQGAVSATSIVIPASLLGGLGVAGSKVQIKYTSLASNVFTAT